MMSEDLEYDEWLETWKPSRHLLHACLPANLHNPFAADRLYEDVETIGDVPRIKKEAPGYNRIPETEAVRLRLDFIVRKQPEWSHDFWERMVEGGVDKARLTKFIDGMAGDWVKGPAIRQRSPLMLALKASVQAHDRRNHLPTAGKYVNEDDDFGEEPFFDVDETALLLQVNKAILSYAMADYVAAVWGERSGSTDHIYLRRGVCMPSEPGQLRIERSYLSSYSLSTGTAELFAQTGGRRVGKQISCIFSCPISAVHDRVIAFAPFISRMPLDQMEFVVAPPVRATQMRYQDEYSGVREYCFE